MINRPLKLYNTPVRRKEIFVPLSPGRVTLYCCGPTVYNYAHIGNLRTYVFEDFLRRTLEYLGFTVDHVVNITDVGHLTSDADSGEDKMEKGALREGKTVWEIADYYKAEFMKDWKRLNLLPPAKWPKATDHIQEQIDLVRILEQKGQTYRLRDGIYFDTATYPKYAEFALLDVDNLEAGIRVGVVEGKKNPTDFALWKFSPQDSKRAMEWDSPWGKGFPGWHLECSAMAMKHLGETLDIHCGGVDHIRVHHTNEIAQSECATGKPFARFWLHGGWLLEDKIGGGAKMSKSNEEFVRLETLIQKGYSPSDYRYFCMTSHYRNYLKFSWESLNSAKDSLSSLRKKASPFMQQATNISCENARSWREKFMGAVCDDVNLPNALGVLNLMLKDSDIPDGERGALIRDFDKILGLNLDEQSEHTYTPPEQLDSELLNLLRERDAARAAKNFARADTIRDIFKQRGFLIIDGPNGSTWKKLL